MSGIWRCPDCGCLALAWSYTHRRGCAYGVTPEHELVYVLGFPEPPTDRHEDEDEPGSGVGSSS
ncbi:MAG: hypothetical protein U0R76_07460 [Candidatus Nanopelagicales bacterium]